MSICLRPYQDAAIVSLRAAMSQHRRVLLTLPTGAGKTAIAATIASLALAQGKPVMFLVHRDELIWQTSRAFDSAGVAHGIIAAGVPTCPAELVQIASVLTLAQRLGSVRKPALIFIDEAHHAVAGTWRRIIEVWPTAWIVGLTATPERLDGQGLTDVFDHMIVGPSTADLIQGGFLSGYRAFAPSVPDLSGVSSARGDFDAATLAGVMDRPAITGDIIEHYKRLAAGKRAIIFAASISHSRNLAAEFNAAGIPSAHVDGRTPAHLRRQLVTDFAEGRLMVLTNVNLFGEGFDVPGVEAVILARPTQSLALHLQQIGRALRNSPGKVNAIILDHAGNIERHGLPDDPRQWSLDSKSRHHVDERPLMRCCPGCKACHQPAPICPECGHRYVSATREPLIVSGDLQEINSPVQHTERFDFLQLDLRSVRSPKPVGRMDSAELEALGRSRGYSNPGAWARKRLEGRLKKANLLPPSTNPPQARP